MGDIDFKVISAAENSNKFQKTRFWKEKSVENVITLGGLPFNSRMIPFHILAVQKINRYIAKQCSHVEFSYFVMGSHLGQRHRPHQYQMKWVWKCAWHNMIVVATLCLV